MVMFYKMYKDRKREWRWSLIAANNRKVAASGEGYRRKKDCLADIKLVKGSGRTPIRES